MPKKQFPKSYILKEEKKYETPDWTDEQKKYLKGVQERLMQARDQRDKVHPEFDNMDFISCWWANERAGNTMLKIKKNRGDTIFQSGTLRHKMMAFLSTYQGLNLKGDISAFNEHEVLINTLGSALEDIVDKTQEIENDEEWRMIRQYEMLKHGYVFVEDIWMSKWEVVKKLTKKFVGKVTGIEWKTDKKRELGSPRRSIISGLCVYLGNIRKYMIGEQPYIFTVETRDRVDLEPIYKDWEMWKYITDEKKSFAGNITENNWVLQSNLKKKQIEVIRYQDKPNNEFQIILNGVPMLPLGFPLTEIRGDGEYTIVQQNLEPIRYNFAYGKSFIFKNKNVVAILDEMMKLAVLKTQKSFLPPYLNLSSKLISRDIFMPGKISRGIGRGEIVPVSEKEVQGVTSSEFGMISEVKRFLDSVTASPTFTGAREEGGRVTATQIIELQKQARIMMGLLVLAASLLEKKLTIKRLTIILENWFLPIDTTIDKARNVLRDRFRYVSRFRRIESEGSGLRIIIPSKEIPSSETIREAEESLKEEVGMPVRIIMLNPDELKSIKITWVVNVNAKDKKSSEYSKLLFDEMIARAMNLGLRLNPQYIEQRFAEVWDEDPAKMFLKGRAGPPTREAGPSPEGEMPTPRTAPRELPRTVPAIKVPGPGQGQTPKPIPPS